MVPAPKIAARIIACLILFLCKVTVYGNSSHLYPIVNVEFQVALPKAPKPPKSPQLPKPPKVAIDTAVNTKLIQRILKAFRFRHNARVNEKERVIEIINQILTDSLVVTKGDIIMLNEALTKRENQQFDSLMSLLNAIAVSHATEPVKPATDSGGKKIVQEPDKTVPGTDLNALVEKMIPILRKKGEEEEAEKIKEEHMKAIRSLYGRPVDQVDTLRLSDSIGARYQLRLSQKINVTGVHPYWMEPDYTGYNYNALSTFSFLGYLVDGKSGDIHPAFQENQVKSIPDALAAGCNLQLLFFDKKTSNILALLKNTDAQVNFVDTLAHLLQQQKSDGVTIYFQNLPAHQRQDFTRFITFLSGSLRSANKNYKVNIVVPAYDKFFNYDLRALRPYVDYFVIDFTQATGHTAGSLSPLDGDPMQSLYGAVSGYTQGEVPPGKLSLLLPYYGAVWKKGVHGHPDVFSRYVSYTDIRKQYPSDTIPMFDESSATFFIEVKDQYGEVKEEIWFDDGISMSMKYDFVLKKGLGGVTIWTLGVDKGYTDLWDALVDKFVVTDTLFLDTVSLRPPIPQHLTLFQRIKRELNIYAILFHDPCSIDVSQYEGDTYFIYIAFSFLGLSLVSGGAYFYFVRVNGEGWKYRKKMLILLILLILLLVVSTFMAFFLNKKLDFVGISSVPGRCHSVPLVNVLIILGIGFVLGLLIMHFLLQPLLKKDDMP
ncbi:glycosyl hydrolase family 18 (putative chitinase) [Chitinophaga niastensis]|uniref:Glycosyl hydrolase family 18 (Putative chitinase) n=1 Tax=Chitinophaga niastensis TaxID=536980 RepID=A0A2P8HGQ1_CHINA|nr:glycosyl hydrolase family 18 protein [Chitinophaga niastensis]PSL45370.1 glycosyl hydrolase family 18 (putative chitinase) [Chitinophaga niastensis]